MFDQIAILVIYAGNVDPKTKACIWLMSLVCIVAYSMQNKHVNITYVIYIKERSK